METQSLWTEGRLEPGRDDHAQSQDAGRSVAEIAVPLSSRYKEQLLNVRSQERANCWDDWSTFFVRPPLCSLHLQPPVRGLKVTFLGN